MTTEGSSTVTEGEKFTNIATFENLNNFAIFSLE